MGSLMSSWTLSAEFLTGRIVTYCIDKVPCNMVKMVVSGISASHDWVQEDVVPIVVQNLVPQDNLNQVSSCSLSPLITTDRRLVVFCSEGCLSYEYLAIG